MAGALAVLERQRESGGGAWGGHSRYRDKEVSILGVPGTSGVPANLTLYLTKHGRLDP